MGKHKIYLSKRRKWATRLSEDGQYILYDDFRKKKTSVMSYHEILFRILSELKMSVFFFRGRVRMSYGTRAKGTLVRFSLHTLCAACYTGYITSFETWREDLQEFRDWLRDSNYQIDHADSNKLNNTKYNLSVMPATVNSSKGNSTAKFPPYVCFVSGHYKNEYRVWVKWMTVKRAVGRYGVEINLICRDPKDYHNCIEELMTMKTGIVAPVRSQKKYWINNCISWALQENGWNSILKQAEIAERNRGCYAIYTAGCCMSLFMQAMKNEYGIAPCVPAEQ